RSWVNTGMAVQWAAFAVAAAIVIFYGVYGYFVESLVRIGFSVYQVMAVLGAIVLVMAIDIPMFKGARSTGAIRWGAIASRERSRGGDIVRVPVGIKVGIVALAVMGSYTGYANYIPQIESKPPQELSLEGGNVTPAQLVKAGEEIFKTKGTCEICHRIGQKGTRAPDLAGIGARAAKTKPGMSAKAYILESLLQPAAYIVEGYPPIMPAVDKPPIALNRSEVW